MTTNLENEVTVLAYHFWDDQGYDAAFGRLALAVRETWRHCGQLRTVLVVNKTRPCIEAFAAENREVEVQVEPSLVPGDINSMSADCNSRLWTRFSTPYVLVIQADGYPLRGGLEEFVGKEPCLPRVELLGAERRLFAAFAADMRGCRQVLERQVRGEGVVSRCDRRSLLHQVSAAP